MHPSVRDDRGWFILMFLPACSAETASLGAEQTNAGVTVLWQKLHLYNIMCVVPLSQVGWNSCFPFCVPDCLLLQWRVLFLCLQVLVEGTASCVVSRKALPGHSVDIDSLHVSHADIIVSQMGEANDYLTQCKSDHRTRCISGCDHPSHVQWTWHNIRSLHYLRVHTGKDMPSIWRMLLRWSLLGGLSCLPYVVYVTVLVTHALQTAPYVSPPTTSSLSILEPWDESQLKVLYQLSCRYICPLRGYPWWWIRGMWTDIQHRVCCRRRWWLTVLLYHVPSRLSSSDW